MQTRTSTTSRNAGYICAIMSSGKGGTTQRSDVKSRRIRSNVATSSFEQVGCDKDRCWSLTSDQFRESFGTCGRHDGGIDDSRELHVCDVTEPEKWYNSRELERRSMIYWFVVLRT